MADAQEDLEHIADVLGKAFAFFRNAADNPNAPINKCLRAYYYGALYAVARNGVRMLEAEERRGVGRAEAVTMTMKGPLCLVLEVVKRDANTVVKTVDVSHNSEEEIERIGAELVHDMGGRGFFWRDILRPKVNP